MLHLNLPSEGGGIVTEPGYSLETLTATRGGDTMKWLLVLLAVLFMVPPAMAGEDPYIGIVGRDCVAGTVNAYGYCPAASS